VQDATINSDLAVSGGTYTLASNGRGTINLTLSGGSISPQIFWIVNEPAATPISSLTAQPQSRTALSLCRPPPPRSAVRARLVMDGIDTSFKDRVGVFETTSSGFNWNQAANAFDVGLDEYDPTSTGTNGTDTVSSNGRAAVGR